MNRRQEPVRVRNRRRVLRAARDLVAERGLEALTMRQLAFEADVSVTTLYNLIGSRDDVVRALSFSVLEDFDQAFGDLKAPDPLERAYEFFDAVIGIVTRDVPRQLVLAALGDEELTMELGYTWTSGGAFADMMRSMIESGQLEPRFSPDLVADQVWSAYTRYLRQWATGMLDDHEFRARTLYALDVSLTALATRGTSERLVAHAGSLEPQLRAARRGSRRPS